MQIQKVKQQKNGYLVNDSIFVPSDPKNSDFQKIQKWIAEGGVIEAFDNLAEAKLTKITEIKSIRDSKNILPILDHSAELFDEEGHLSGVNSFFVFHTDRHPTNPAADPSSILTSIIVSNQAIPYSTKDLEGSRKIVNITPKIAQSLVAHLTLRNNNNYKLCDAIEKFIKNSCSTLKELETVTWSTNYLT